MAVLAWLGPRRISDILTTLDVASYPGLKSATRTEVLRNALNKRTSQDGPLKNDNGIYGFISEAARTAWLEEPLID